MFFLGIFGGIVRPLMTTGACCLASFYMCEGTKLVIRNANSPT